MDAFTRDDLRRLMDTNNTACVSLYMPTHRTGREIRDDALRCKNLINAAEDGLRDWGLRTPAARDILKPARELQTDDEFWKNQSDGLAIFATQDLFRYYRAPLPFDELVVANKRFHLKFLLPLLQDDGRFCLLAASQNRLRFFRGTHYSISEINVETLPKNLQDALQIDEYLASLQLHSFRSFGPAIGGRGEAMFHGHGSADLDVKKKDEILQYFHRVDAGLREFLREERIPLVFAGVEYLFPIFREASSYRWLVKEPVRGNPDDLSAKELHQKAWSLVEPYFRERQRAAVEKYADRAARKLASDSLEEIIAAARQGRVDTLFIRKDQQLWGVVEDPPGKVTRCEKSAAGAEDLLDYAAVHTLLNGGVVYALDQEHMPHQQWIAAMFRYAIEPASPDEAAESEAGSAGEAPDRP